MYTFGKSISYCCTLLLWWQHNRTYEAQRVFAVERGDWKNQKERGQLPEAGTPAPMCPLRMSNFSMFPSVYSAAERAADTSFIKAWLYPRSSLAPHLVRLRTVCCSCEKTFAYNPWKTNRNISVDWLFVLLLFCKCTIKIMLISFLKTRSLCLSVICFRHYFLLSGMVAMTTLDQAQH